MKKGKVWRHPEIFQRMAVERFKCCENIEHLAKELGVARQPVSPDRAQDHGLYFRQYCTAVLDNDGNCEGSEIVLSAN
jgi:hypothetical protein